MTYVATHIGNCFRYAHTKRRHDTDARTARFDFTGCGESDGEFSYSGYKREVEDLRCVVQWLRADGWQVVCICGHSKAAAAVLTYAALHDDVPLVVNMAGR
jgi:alpha/beta superfamily hydrolase